MLKLQAVGKLVNVRACSCNNELTFKSLNESTLEEAFCHIPAVLVRLKIVSLATFRNNDDVVLLFQWTLKQILKSVCKF